MGSGIQYLHLMYEHNCKESIPSGREEFGFFSQQNWASQTLRTVQTIWEPQFSAHHLHGSFEKETHKALGGA